MSIATWSISPQRQRLPADLTRAHANLPRASQLLCPRDPSTPGIHRRDVYRT